MGICHEAAKEWLLKAGNLNLQPIKATVAHSFEGLCNAMHFFLLCRPVISHCEPVNGRLPPQESVHRAVSQYFFHREFSLSLKSGQHKYRSEKKSSKGGQTYRTGKGASALKNLSACLESLFHRTSYSSLTSSLNNAFCSSLKL